MPSADRARPAYGVGESSMARMLVKAFGLAPKGSDAARILKKSKALSSKCTAKEDLADIVQCVLHDHCAAESSYTISKIHDTLDALASSPSHDRKLEVIGRFARNVTILELKWFVRIVSRCDLSLGIGDKALLSCLHPAAPSIWNITQDLCVVCQRIAYINPKLVLSDDINNKLKSVELFTAFKPMLCSRANSVAEICTAYQQGFSGTIDDGLCLEVKYDGERVQLHKSGANYRFWSRAGREWSSSYGEHGDSLKGGLTYRLHANGSTFATHVTDCILDGEMLAFNGLTHRFVTKATGYDVKRPGSDCQFDSSKDVMPCFIVFDVLYLNGQLLTEMPLSQRKRILLTMFPSVKSTCEEVSSEVETCFRYTKNHGDDDSLEDYQSQQDQLLSLFAITKEALYLGGFLLTQPDKTRLARCFDTWVQRGAEGMVAKALCTPYTPNGRAGAGWWKLKPDYVLGLCVDLDCLLVGAYASTSAVTCMTVFSTFLCAIANDIDSAETENKRRRLQSDHSSPQSFLTFCQVSCGLKRDQLESLNHRLESHWRQYDRRKINCNETEWLRVSGERPDFWIPPRHSLVLQIHAAEMIPSASYSAGFTLRFPRIADIREDKTWQDVVSISEIKKIYHDTKEVDYFLVSLVPRRKAGALLTTKGKMVKGKTVQSSDDEDNKSNAESDEDNKPSSCTTPKNASTIGIPTRRVQTSSKSSTSFQTRYCHPLKDLVETESSTFAGVEFCLYISSRFSGPSAGLETKRELEKEILKRSGKVVQNAGSSTTYIVADRTTAKISNFIEATRKSTGRGKEGGYDIVSTEWLIQCIQANRLLPLRKDQVFAARPSTMLQFDGPCERTPNGNEDLDTSGLSSNSCVRSISPTRLRAELFAQTPVRRLSASEYIQLFNDHNFSDLALPLCGVSIVLYGVVDTSPQLKLMIADLRSLQAIVHGPVTDISSLLPEQTGIVTHVAAMNGNVHGFEIEPVLEEIRKQTGQSSLPIAVTLQWAMDCASQKALLPVSSYHL
ncbi:DNA ligase 4 [Taenia crassiceps]|uniref:DNA ligase n=1 Tax=Taenia crassiceps TaxID=6207 RepID=A0ABR4QID6_9CEST